MKKIEEYIEKVGWAVISIVPTEKDPDTIPFTYTVGFIKTFNHPEVILSGLPAQLGKDLLNVIGFLIKKGEQFTHDSTTDKIAENYDVMFINVDEKYYQEYLPIAVTYNKQYQLPFSALQMIWPDKEGIFPNNQNYDKSFRQEILSDMI
ncbi:MAG: DUF4262 domain-containing protein [Candidatus Hodarchaeota archaeon]